MISKEKIEFKGFRSYHPTRKILGDDKDVTLGHSNVGWFFLYDSELGLAYCPNTCRESIEYYHEDKNGYNNQKNKRFWGFSHVNFDTNRLEKLNECFSYIEKKLKLKEKTIFHPTDRAGVVVVECSPFWIKTDENRGLFTLMLRMGALYYKDNFEKAIDTYELAALVKGPILHILEGNTKFIGKGMGTGKFVILFSYRKEYGGYKDNYASVLVKPD